jgi:hypothetical protein
MTLLGLCQVVVHENVMLTWQGEMLHVSAPKGTLTSALKQALAQHKPTLRTWRQQVVAWDIDTRELWEERAAIMEYDGSLSRERAEWQSFLCVICVKGAETCT